MTAILADGIFKCISLDENDNIRIKIYWNMFPWVQLTVGQHLLGNGLAPKQQAITWTNDDLVHWRTYAVPGGGGGGGGVK